MDHSPEEVDRERHRLLAGESRVRVLEVLRAEGGPLAIAEIAARVDLHPNTVRLHLGQLVAAGLAAEEREQRDRPGRPRLVYSATGAAAGPGQEDGYRMLAEALVEHLERTVPDPAAEAVAAGEAWGRRLAGERPGPVPAPGGPGQAAAELTGLTGLLDDLGFAPRAVESGRAVELHRCPFRQVADDHSPVVCGVHLGLMRGALERTGGAVRASSLQPFVTPDLCLARFEAEPAAS